MYSTEVITTFEILLAVQNVQVLAGVTDVIDVYEVTIAPAMSFELVDTRVITTEEGDT